MQHRRRRGKLGVKTHHRQALLRNLVRSLVIRRRIRTTLAKAKCASSVADRMVQIAKRGDLQARRLLISRLGCEDTARMLIQDIAPHFKERQGGYTRVLRLSGWRAGDGAQNALLEFTTVIEAPEKPKKPKREKKPKEPKHEPIPEEKAKKEKMKEKEIQPTVTDEKKAPSPKPEKKESEKKGGFLSALRRFLKGDDEGR